MDLINNGGLPERVGPVEEDHSPVWKLWWRTSSTMIISVDSLAINKEKQVPLPLNKLTQINNRLKYLRWSLVLKISEKQTIISCDVYYNSKVKIFISVYWEEKETCFSPLIMRGRERFDDGPQQGFLFALINTLMMGVRLSNHADDGPQ